MGRCRVESCVKALRQRLCCVLLSLAGAASIAGAATYDEALEAFQRDDFAVARGLAEPLAQEGNREAQTLLGVLYWRGKGVGRNDGLAFLWFTKAAAQESAEALSYLGRMYEMGEGTAEDKQKAFEAFTRSAELGSASGKQHLGRAYHYGIGVRKDVVRARYWYEQADAQEFLGERRERTPSLIGPPAPLKLASECRPRTPPVATMRRLGVSTASGTLTFAVDRDGRVRGVTEQSVSDPELRYEAVAYFSDSLRSEQCLWDASSRGRRFVVPFRFNLTGW